MDILIIGNGFDLAHELETKYTDFLNYCIKMYSINVTLGRIHNYGDFTNNLWLRHFIMQKQLGDNWINLEEEIYNVIKKIDSDLYNLTTNYINKTIQRVYTIQEELIGEDFNLKKLIHKSKPAQIKYKVDDDGYICVNGDVVNSKKYYIENYQGLINLLYDQLREFTKAFNDYLLKEVSPQIGNKKYNLLLSNKKSIRVLNFNYTNTYEKLYNSNSIIAEEIPQYVYVHGRVCDSEDCNLIFGTHSFYNNLPNDINEEINVEFNIFKKHNQRHRYGTIESYQTLLRELYDDKRPVTPVFHIIGHSLDKADHNILRHIFCAKENPTINIYYHNQDALDRLINNITKIIGEEEVMTRVRFIYQHDPQRGILRKLNNINEHFH